MKTEKKQTMEHKSDDETNSNWFTRYSHQMISSAARGLWNERMSGDHPNYNIAEINQNTKQSPRDMETCCHSKSSGKPSVNAGWKKLLHE